MSEIQILVVDDDDVEIMAIKRAFQKHNISNPILVARDGIEALEVLRGVGKRTLSSPYLILLDLNLPRMNGIEFLKELRADPIQRTAVVFVLTTSSSANDRAAAYEQGVAGYIVKARAGNDLAPLIRLLQSYWSIVELP